MVWFPIDAAAVCRDCSPTSIVASLIGCMALMRPARVAASSQIATAPLSSIATDDPSSIGKADAVLVCVKSWQVREAVESIRPAIGGDTIIVPLENGMEAPDHIAAAAGREHAAGGLCGLVSFVVAPGYIRHI